MSRAHRLLYGALLATSVLAAEESKCPVDLATYPKIIMPRESNACDFVRAPLDLGPGFLKKVTEKRYAQITDLYKSNRNSVVCGKGKTDGAALVPECASACAKLGLGSNEIDVEGAVAVATTSGRTVSFAKDAGGMIRVDGSSWVMKKRDIAHANTARLNAVLQHVLKDGDTLVLDTYNELFPDGGYFLFSGGVSNIVSKQFGRAPPGEATGARTCPTAVCESTSFWVLGSSASLLLAWPTYCS